ncbi:hypothetical protein O976_11650 [Mycobacterium avium subsp. paratuberculosis 10-8425]|nr:hypothetical protein O978_11510 [Mycobacterium avium subsp. paratuberculosis 10-5864]ETB32197.1 hypothetical protein O977_12315 [Mycobacterium avium subsp. paratuberculosis 10-5975]ETB51627.1 hypothetical protein O976_11650 [Mycobacterium avium subsp. paratuberculosis 10-8425]
MPDHQAALPGPAIQVGLLDGVGSGDVQAGEAFGERPDRPAGALRVV